MKPLLLLVAIMLLNHVSHAEELTITINHIKKQQGLVMLALYNNAEHYANNKQAVIAVKQQPFSKSISMSFKNLPKGEYAVKLYHDVNSNGKLDTNIVGIPTEAYGFSNNVGKFGPPPFEKAKVVLDKNKAITIDLR